MRTRSAGTKLNRMYLVACGRLSTLLFEILKVTEHNFAAIRWMKQHREQYHSRDVDSDVPETRGINWILYLCFSSVGEFCKCHSCRDSSRARNLNILLCHIQRGNYIYCQIFIEFVSPWLSLVLSAPFPPKHSRMLCCAICSKHNWMATRIVCSIV